MTLHINAAVKKATVQKPAARPASSRKTLTWLVIAAIVVLGIIGWFVFEQIATHNDQLRFKDAATVKTAVANRLVAYLGDNVVSTREQDECFNAEQGPYDNGKLWCQVATVIRLKGDVDYASVAQQYVKFGQASGWLTGSNEPFTGSWIMKNQGGVKCQIEYQNSSGKNQGIVATRVPFVRGDQIVIAIACADRAMAAYYPYDK